MLKDCTDIDLKFRIQGEPRTRTKFSVCRAIMIRTLAALVGAALAVSYYYVAVHKPYTLQVVKDLNPQYDYIIVGGGTAGAVLAARLSEGRSPHLSVLLLEAGGDSSPFLQIYSHIPGFGLRLFNSSLDWAHYEPDSSLPHRGFGLGGSSLINQMWVGKPSPLDDELWQKTVGDPSWTQDMTKAWNKVLGQQGRLLTTESPLSDLGKAVHSGLLKEGFRSEPPPGEERLGPYVQPIALAVGDGQRQSTFNRYLRPALGRFEFHVVPNAKVYKILLSQDSQVTGIEYEYEGKAQRVLINKELILAAGTIGTPTLLMASGIGPKEVLENAGIPLRVASPSVGREGTASVMGSLRLMVDQDIGYPSRTFDSWINLVKYFVQGKGPLAYTSVELLAVPAALGVTGQPKYVYAFDTGSVLDQNGNPKGTLTIQVWLTAPESDFEMGIDHEKRPVITSSSRKVHRDDWEVIVDALSSLLPLLTQEPLSSLNPHVEGCAALDRSCVEEHVHTGLMGGIGGVNMGEAVDSRFRFKGIRRLRVVDASVIPVPLSAFAFPYAAVVALGEKCSEDILKGN